MTFNTEADLMEKTKKELKKWHDYKLNLIKETDFI